MKKRDSLLVSLRDCTVGWIASCLTLYPAISWTMPKQDFFSILLPAFLLVALVILIIAFPISIFSRSHLPSDRPSGNSLILCLTGILLSQLIVILAVVVPLFLFGAHPPAPGEFYGGAITPILAAAAVAGGVIGHMAGVPSKLKSWQLAFEYDPEKK